MYIYIVHGYLNRDNEPVSTCTVVRHTGNQQDLIRVFQEILDNTLINITISNEPPPPFFVTTVFIQSFPFLGKENAQIITPSPYPLKTNKLQSETA